jgi:hypothetical protein
VGLALHQARARANGWIERLPRPAGPTDSGTAALVLGLGTLAVLGLVANDSSVAVPATMLIVAVPVLALRATDPGATT